VKEIEPASNIFQTKQKKFCHQPKNFLPKKFLRTEKKSQVILFPKTLSDIFGDVSINNPVQEEEFTI